MNKTVIVVSTYADILLRESQPDVKFHIFRNLTELANYISNTPIRADVLYITRETLQPAVNTALEHFLRILDNPFLNTKKVEYVTETGSEEIESIRYIIAQRNITNWKVTTGGLTREFVSGLISGTLSTDDIAPVRRGVYRQRRSTYVEERLKSKDSLNDPYISDEENLSEVPDEQVFAVIPMETGEVCQTVTVSGLERQERTVFAFILAQYLSYSGKTVIIERDFEYLTLSDIAYKSGVACAKIGIDELYGNTNEIFRFIRTTKEKLIVIACGSKSDYDYSFLCNFVYNNLINDVSSLVVEQDLEEIASTTPYIAVVPNNIVDILKTVKDLPDNYEENCSFVGINMRNVKELNVLNSSAMETIVKDLLQYNKEVTIPIVNIRSLKLGGEAHDLRMLIKSR